MATSQARTPSKNRAPSDTGAIASQSDVRHGQTTCSIDVSPGIVDAGSDMTLQVHVSFSPTCDLRGHILFIRDETGTPVSSAELTQFEGETHQTSELLVKAPVEPGEYTWSAVCPAVVKQDVLYEEASTRIPFVVKPHTTHVIVWDIPSAIVAGEPFRIRVGLKCSSECRLTDGNLFVYDQDGAQAAAGTLPHDKWPETGLYALEVKLEAPAAEGLHMWMVKTSGWSDGIPHGEGSVDFGVRVVPRAEHLVTVEAVDRLSQAPLSGAHVVMRPYNALTDDRGVAQMWVAKGAYRLFVSQTRYLTFRLPVDVDGNMTARAELDLELVPERE